MIAAKLPQQRGPEARLMVVAHDGTMRIAQRERWTDELKPGDLVVANDAATIPASLAGVHLRTGAAIEVRLAGRHSLDPNAIDEWTAIVFGEGDWRTRTEHRALPPALVVGDALALGPLHARVIDLLEHPRLVAIRFDATPDRFWAGVTAHGRAVQYAHLEAELALWDVQTPIAGYPVALEAPSAGFVLDWRSLAALRGRGIGFAALTHAAGLSSTGDDALDARLPFDEAYSIPRTAAAQIAATRRGGGRIVAVGTTVVRALEHAARSDGSVPSGGGVADIRIDERHRLRIVDALISGTHEPGTTHHLLLRAFVDAAALSRVDRALEDARFRTHEFGDSVLVQHAKMRARLPHAA
ncbi:MAG TPA: S-adenosylmethionine:tRNA ribosyltransferase-isomerase [Casimicrobiaceae bacterium]|nr:S-adenosylmethionine:tRNA ribosyltransferase-isomerase [Casimicrobiaceae bacterium]